jgi:hypothetical protein
MTSVMSSTAQPAGESTAWQDRLEECCRDARINPPVFQMFSDRRGGRTAWSSKVVVDGHCLAARYWYDGRFLNNAKEDVAEVAYMWLTTGS